MSAERDAKVNYLMRAFGLTEAAAIDTIDLLTNDDRTEEFTTGLKATMERLVAEAPSDTTCPRCHGSGLIWLGTSSKRRARVNEDWEPCMAAFQCPVCPDDGLGNWKGTGRISA